MSAPMMQVCRDNEDASSRWIKGVLNHRDHPLEEGSANNNNNYKKEACNTNKMAGLVDGDHEECPRCESRNTKFCYYNNYSLSQPRFFCKACRRYWTKGGALRNVPVGGAPRKNNKRHRRPTAPPPPPPLIPSINYYSNYDDHYPLISSSSSSDDPVNMINQLVSHDPHQACYGYSRSNYNYMAHVNYNSQVVPFDMHHHEYSKYLNSLMFHPAENYVSPPVNCDAMIGPGEAARPVLDSRGVLLELMEGGSAINMAAFMKMDLSSYGAADIMTTGVNGDGPKEVQTRVDNARKEKMQGIINSAAM